MVDNPFDDPRLTAMGLFIEVLTGLSAKFAPIIAAEGMSGSDFDTLIRLIRSPGQGLRMSELASQTSLSTSGMTRVVDRLEHRGLVSRAPAADDRRSSFVTLTDNGRQRLASVVPKLAAEIERWFTGQLSPEQLDAFLGTLRGIRAAVHPHAEAGAHS